MSFQSLDFALFLPIVFLAYWLGSAGDVRRQNWIILLASLIFYGWWDWRFVALVLANAFFNYHVALSMQRRTVKSERAHLLWLSVTLNLAVLFVFKYLDFFQANFSHAFSFFGMKLNEKSFEVILPVGISFYTFQSLGYVIDVYRKRFPASKDPVAFLCFMTFYPKMTAGPIERASNLLVQFYRPRVFEESSAVDGLRRILLGLFMKVVVSDNIGALIDKVSGAESVRTGSDLLLMFLLKPMHVYTDFAGYSEIAIGVSALFGLRLSRNFSYPFFATNIVMLWQRWHMSLTGWFRDYVFMLLPAKRTSRWIMVRNISVIYILSGLWHGASWNYIAWGLLNAVFCGAYLYFFHFRRRTVLKNPFMASVSTYLLFSIGFFPLAADGFGKSVRLVSMALSKSVFSLPGLFMSRAALLTLCLTVALLAMEWASRNDSHGLAWVARLSALPIRWMVYIALLMLVFINSGHPQPFIYMRF
jgi:alginate O-acetyltransferase complex protein AlgI